LYATSAGCSSTSFVCRRIRNTDVMRMSAAENDPTRDSRPSAFEKALVGQMAAFAAATAAG